jgi:hypothetical protein
VLDITPPKISIIVDNKAVMCNYILLVNRSI